MNMLNMENVRLGITKTTMRKIDFHAFWICLIWNHTFILHSNGNNNNNNIPFSLKCAQWNEYMYFHIHEHESIAKHRNALLNITHFINVSFFHWNQSFSVASLNNHDSFLHLSKPSVSPVSTHTHVVFCFYFVNFIHLEFLVFNQLDISKI